jgi:3-phosphoshikimate 1-carboxyvinyltransferase
MRARVERTARLTGEVVVPGDKSVAHRWLVLAATARGRSRLVSVPVSLDVRSTAACLACLSRKARPALEVWSRNPAPTGDGGGSTWNEDGRALVSSALEVDGEGLAGLRESEQDLDCGNSGTSMRLLAGVVATRPFTTVLRGDGSLSRRPMERVAVPLRAMGATVATTDGHAPITVKGGTLRGIGFVAPVASAQVKSAVLFAALGAEGVTTVAEPAPTRDHTERALQALGAPIEIADRRIRLTAFQHDAFDASVPGDPSSAAFVVAAAALTGSAVTIRDVGLNPSRLHFLEVMRRMGIETSLTLDREELGEPVGSIEVATCAGLSGTTVRSDELPLVVDEVPVLAALAAHARGESWFLGGAELRLKESDRLEAIGSGIRALGGDAADEGDDLVVRGGGLRGGRADAVGDHRIAMSMVVGALAADGASDIVGVEAAEVSFPGFLPLLRHLGARIEVTA